MSGTSYDTVMVTHELKRLIAREEIPEPCLGRSQCIVLFKRRAHVFNTKSCERFIRIVICCEVGKVNVSEDEKWSVSPNLRECCLSIDAVFAAPATVAVDKPEQPSVRCTFLMPDHQKF